MLTAKWRLAAARILAHKDYMARAVFMRFLLAALLLATALPARAVEAPYEKNLLRLAEILGSLQYLRSLCGEKGDEWRDAMDAILITEHPEPARRAELVARFNRGYRAYSDIYHTCTASATEAIARYMKEGEALSRDTANRFGN
jgi:uncharacterized protein (TIGR02301 family)